MCRLFALSSAPHRVRATFWLLEAPDSVTTQSHHDPDGTGLGVFDAEGRAQVFKQPIAAFEDTKFAREARQVQSTTFVAHVRFASTGAVEQRNTHPFTAHGRIFAHNGVIEDVERLERELGSYREMVEGDTDSARFFALITRHIDGNGGDVGAGIAQAATWVAGNLPLYSLNLVLTTATDMWALRYPQTHSLYVLSRPPGGHFGRRHLDQTSPTGHVRMRSGELTDQPAVVIASEQMDEDPGWRPLRSGELLHVDARLTVSSRMVLEHPPTRPLALASLRPEAAASQTAA